MKPSVLCATIVLAVGVVGVTAAAAGPRLVTGKFGGDHIGLDLGQRGGAVAFDCGAGTIDEPLTPTADGAFAVRGHLGRPSGGPARAEDAPPAQEADYAGHATAAAVTFTVRPAGGTLSRTYRAERGRAAHLLRCL